MATRLPGTAVAQRLMPKDHWDWSIPVPFSQGWKCGDFIFKSQAEACRGDMPRQQ